VIIVCDIMSIRFSNFSEPLESQLEPGFSEDCSAAVNVKTIVLPEDDDLFDFLKEGYEEQVDDVGEEKLSVRVTLIFFFFHRYP